MNKGSGFAQYLAAQPAIQEQAVQQDQEFSLMGSAWSQYPTGTSSASVSAVPQEILDKRQVSEVIAKRGRLKGVTPLQSGTKTTLSAAGDPSSADAGMTEEGEAVAAAKVENQKRLRLGLSALPQKLTEAEGRGRKKEIKLKDITFDELRLYFGMTQKDAAAYTDVHINTFDKICKKVGLVTSSWPGKKIIALNDASARLERTLLLIKPTPLQLEKGKHILKYCKSLIDKLVISIYETLEPVQPVQPAPKKKAKKKMEEKDSADLEQTTETETEVGGDEKEKQEETIEAPSSSSSSSTHTSTPATAAAIQAKDGVHKEAKALGNELSVAVKDACSWARLTALAFLRKAGIAEKEATTILKSVNCPMHLRYTGPASQAATWNDTKRNGFVSSASGTSQYQKGWLEENRDENRSGPGRLPIRDELLDTLGTKVALRVIEKGDDSDDEHFEKSILELKSKPVNKRVNITSKSDRYSKKKSRKLCHDGLVDLPKLSWTDTSHINTDGLTIMLVEPRVFRVPMDNSMEIIPTFVFPREEREDEEKRNPR